jgi:hypothetical protein
MLSASPRTPRRASPWVRYASLALVALFACPGRAQDSAVLGIYEDAALSQTHGIMDGPSKELWIGVHFVNPVPGGGFTGAEFSIAGLEAFALYTVEFLDSPAVVLGTLAAPADTLNGSGGVDVAWPLCRPDGTVLARLTLYAPSPPQNQALVVRRMYPPSNPLMSFPFLMPCDIPCYGCHVDVVPGTYTLNPLVGTESATWSSVRQLYR